MMRNVSIAMDAFLSAPWLLLAIVATVVGAWRGRIRGAGPGMKAAAVTAVIGIWLFAAFAAVTAFYYANGGH